MALKICQKHWDEIKKQIENSPYSWMISRSGEEAAAKVADELKGENKPVDYDPLMAANMLLWNNAMEVAGLACMGPDDFCPVCKISEKWLEFAVRDALEGAAEAVAKQKEEAQGL